MFKDLIYRIRTSEYLTNVGTLASGTTVAQAISLFTAPVLYRIYSKEDYGTLGLYMAITGVVGVFSTMQYLQPILLEKHDAEAKKVMWLNRILNLAVTFIVLIFIFLFGEYLATWLNNKEITRWLFLAPISIFFSGQNQILSTWANRKKKYRILSYNAILTALLVPMVSISLGLYKEGALGLFIGLLASQVVPSIFLFYILTKKENFGLKYLSLEILKLKAKEFSDYPKYNLPSAFINMFSNQLPVFMLSIHVGPAIVGVYNLCVRMLGLPIQLIGGAVSEVFKQKATQDFNEKGSFSAIYRKTFFSLVIIAIVPLILILALGPDIFTIIFGENWREAGVLAQILIFMFIIKLIVSPLSYSYFIKGRLRENMMWHFLLLFSTVGIFWIGFEFTENYKKVLLLYSLNFSFIYLIYLYRSNIFSK